MEISDVFDFYEIDINYVKYLYTYDKEIFYNESDENYEDKPYIGIIVMYNKFNYFVPLTSGKENHITLKNTGKSYILMHETLKRKNINKDKDIYKLIKESSSGNHDDDEVKKIYGLIEFYKAIPVPNGFYKKIKITAHKNQDLLQKEFNFCLSKKYQIVSKAIRIINEQHKTHIVNFCQCDYNKLEKECIKFSYKNMTIELKDKYRTKEFIEIHKEFDFSLLVNISKGCTYSRVEGFNNDNPDLQHIKIYAKDEFGQEKYIKTIVKIKDSDLPDDIKHEELVTVK